MDRLTAGTAIAQRRREVGISWEAIAEALDRSPVWATSAVLGQQPLDATQVAVVQKLLDLDAETTAALASPPVRGAAAVDTTGPLVYRLHEALQVYGHALEELIGAEFGDGIMSAIDFELHMERKADPKGDRVVLTFDGKFLPYRVF